MLIHILDKAQRAHHKDVDDSSSPKCGLSTCFSWSPGLAAARISLVLNETLQSMQAPGLAYRTTVGTGCSPFTVSIENVSLDTSRASGEWNKVLCQQELYGAVRIIMW